MPYQFLTTEPAVQGGAGNTFEKNLFAGNFSYLQMTLTGTTAASQTLSLDDLGSVTISQSGKQRIRQDLGDLVRQANIRGGFVSSVSGSAATAERIVIPIFFFHQNLPNALRIRNNSEWSIKVEFKNAMATRFDTNPVNLRVDLFDTDEIFQSYIPILLNQDLQGGGAGDKNDTLSGVNTAGLYLKDANSVINSVTVKVDNKTIVGNTPFGVLRDGTNLFERVETSGQDLVLVPIGLSGDEQATRNANTEVEADFSAAGTLSITKQQIEWLSADIRNRNRNEIDANLALRG